MRWLASHRLRLFLICWLVYTVHFATNVVREHYPAFAFIEHGDFRLDEYVDRVETPDGVVVEPLHSDIFVHEKGDGHAYIGNQVAGSLPAIPPLFLARPLLDRLESARKAQLANAAVDDAHYETEYPGRQKFMSRVKKRGLDWRFGAATAITSAFCMAPLCALLAVLLFGILVRRGVATSRAVGLTLIFAFGTPVFYRSAHLSHNVFLMIVTLLAFRAVWPREGEERVPALRRLWGGFWAGWGLALDYAGVIGLLAIYGYLVLARMKKAGFARSFGESLVFVVGSVPPVGFLLFTQWWMYGDPFLPGQYHMPEVNYTDHGWRGFGWPTLDVFIRNLVDLDWGLLPFGPVLALAVIPVAFYRKTPLVVPRRERWAMWTFVGAFVLFCAANRYSLMQWNTGFRYLLPVVPFLFLLLADHLARWPRFLVFAIGLAAVLNSWVLAMVRYTRPTRPDLSPDPAAVPECWRRVLQEGVQLPWLRVLQQTTADPGHWLHWRIWPELILGCTIAIAFGIWKLGAARAAVPEVVFAGDETVRTDP